MKSWIAGLVVGLVALSFTLDADAQRRLGGGKSFGKQSAPVQQRQATPPAQQTPQAAPAQTAPQAAPAAAPAAGAAAAGAAGAAKAASPWKGALLGAAAGLGLMALASALGFGEGFATLMLVLLAGVVLMMVVGFFLRRARPQAAMQGAGSSGYGPVGYETSPAPQPMQRNAEPAAPAAAPASLGARPGSAMDELLRGGASAAPATPFGIPEGFDTAGFVANAKANFAKLQAAWDTGNVIEIGDFTTNDLFIALTHELRARGNQAHKTEIVKLDAELLGIESGAAEHMASVKFDGVLKIDGEEEKVLEVWNLTKPVDGKSGWLLAGIQQVS